MFFCIPIWALSSTTNTLISNINGQKRGNEILKFTTKIVKISLALMLVCGLVFYVFDYALFQLFTDDVSLINDASKLLPIVLICFVLFPISTIYFNAIVAIEDGKASVFIEVINVGVYLLYLFIASKYYNAGLFMLWCSELFYWFLLGLCCFFYFGVFKRHQQFIIK
jgi:Na+-driven multidrug efflux pump